MSDSTTRPEYVAIIRDGYILDLEDQLYRAKKLAEDNGVFAHNTAIQLEKLRGLFIVAETALHTIEEIYVDGCDTYEDWKRMGTIARTTLETLDTLRQKP